MTIDELVGEIESKKAPAPLDQLEALETELGKKLPADYRRFLIACNGGFAGGRFWFEGPTPEGKKADAGVNHIGGFRRQGHFSLKWARECYEGRIPDTLLWIMDDPFGNAICLGIQGKHRGKVYFWDHENEPDTDEWDGKVETARNLKLLANSFSDFVAGLQEPEDDRDAERKALESGAFPKSLENQVRKIASDYPNMRDLIRALCLRIFDEKGFLAIHADDLSRTLADVIFWLYQTSRITKGVIPRGQLDSIMLNWIRHEPDKLGLDGYSLNHLSDWWDDRINKGVLKYRNTGAQIHTRGSGKALGKTGGHSKAMTPEGRQLFVEAASAFLAAAELRQLRDKQIKEQLGGQPGQVKVTEQLFNELPAPGGRLARVMRDVLQPHGGIRVAKFRGRLFVHGELEGKYSLSVVREEDIEEVEG